MNSTTLQARRDRLMPAGVPRYVRCYESPADGPASWDRFTVVFTGRAAAIHAPGQAWHYPYVGLSGHGEHAGCPVDRPSSRHLGKRVPFSALPEQLQAVALADYREIWRLNPPPRS